jgi:hypothetical protein
MINCGLHVAQIHYWRYVACTASHIFPEGLANHTTDRKWKCVQSKMKADYIKIKASSATALGQSISNGYHYYLPTFIFAGHYCTLKLPALYIFPMCWRRTDSLLLNESLSRGMKMKRPTTVQVALCWCAWVWARWRPTPRVPPYAPAPTWPPARRTSPTPSPTKRKRTHPSRWVGGRGWGNNPPCRAQVHEFLDHEFANSKICCKADEMSRCIILGWEVGR